MTKSLLKSANLSKDQKQINKQIGELFVRSGLAKSFDIVPGDDLYKKENDQAYMLYGFLFDVVNGRLNNSLNTVVRWMETGEHVLGVPLELKNIRKTSR